MSKILSEKAKGTDSFGLTIETAKKVIDLSATKVKWKVEKFIAEDSEEIIKKHLKPYEVVEVEHNCLLNEGISNLIDLICGLATPTKWDSANARIGVGDASTTPAATQTALQAVASRTAWAASTAYSLGTFVRPTSITDANMFVYECTTAGTSGTTEPTWPTTDGATVTDGTVVWTARRRKWFKGMNAGYPQKSGQKSIWEADFVNGEAQFPWREETIVNAADDSGQNLCRQNTDLGTKPAGQTWRLTGEITWS